MKKLIVMCSLIVWGIEGQAQSNSDIECDGNGLVTHLVYANGVNWSDTEAFDNIKTYIPAAVDKNRIDPKGNIETHSAYNHANGFHWDMLEAISQFLVNNGESENSAYSLVFNFMFFGVNTLASLPVWTMYDSFENFVLYQLNPVLFWQKAYKTNLDRFYTNRENDTQYLVKLVAEKLIKKERVVAIGDSQGTFFLNELYRRLEIGHFIGNIENLEDFDFEEQSRFLVSVHIAAATGPINPINKTVLNSSDIIRFTSLPVGEEVKAGITFFEPIGITLPDGSSDLEGLDYRPFPEPWLNHSLTGTYLNIKGSDYPALQNLRQFTIDSIHEAAELLPLPCVYCVSEEFPDGQLGVETPDYGFVADTALVTGNVILRDGVEVCGESVIEVLDENLLIMDRSTLWDVKMSVSGIGEYTGEGYIADSKLSNLEIRDTSTAARFSSNSSVVNGGVIVNDGTNLNTDGRAEIYQSTLTDVNVFNSQIWRSTLSNLSIEKSVIDSIFIDAGSGVNASYISDSHVVNSHVANSRIERSSIINSDIIENSIVTDSGITGDTTRTLIRGSQVYYAGVTDSTLTNETIVSYSSVNGSSLSGAHISQCLVNGVNASGYNCINGVINPW